MMSLPTRVMCVLIPNFARPSRSILSMSTFVYCFDSTTMLPVQMEKSRGGIFFMQKNITTLLSLEGCILAYTSRAWQICRMRRTVDAFQPKMRMWLLAATVVRPLPSSSSLVVIPSVMKPTRIAKVNMPPTIIITITERSRKSVVSLTSPAIIYIQVVNNASPLSNVPKSLQLSSPRSCTHLSLTRYHSTLRPAMRTKVNTASHTSFIAGRAASAFSA
mmetsp:Transcript_27042/g.58997  ORF Transcript_27042/g.58997 Transcript_27042/m.58997 type:complete len:218 (-) Transcript_27042:404-1057(-)